MDFYFLSFCWWNVDVTVESRSFALNMLLFFFKWLIELLKQLDSQGQSRDSNSYWSHILENITDGQLSDWHTHTHTLRLESKAHQCYVMIMWFHFFEEVPQQLAETHLINTEHVSTKNMTDVLQLWIPSCCSWGSVRRGSLCVYIAPRASHWWTMLRWGGPLWRWTLCCFFFVGEGILNKYFLFHEFIRNSTSFCWSGEWGIPPAPKFISIYYCSMKTTHWILHRGN